ncbi:hypothetical protein FXB40_30290 [Bradyrhizobium rifense]|uniref:Uncharacterized protein n=1 Tax=Bradyrhizobium rifense TaxID=515499 RepID=A0A5D3KI87_9BRAD|nr:hypothetical protein [Bradyrhizobium rifense]TYL90918.1 hypothetical protein FXB40_30290 [Bradyrhizobium rifense]
MNSSTSSSETDPGWGRSITACLGTLIGAAALVLALMVVVDPYDSGKLGLLGIKGVDNRLTQITAASRARDPNFNAAILGNSTAQMIEPAELSRAAGLRFVQLYTTGSAPREQLAVLDFFLRNHRQVGALVIAADPGWCVHARPKEEGAPFPYWLYDRSVVTYAVRLISWQAIEQAFQRLSIGLGWRRRMNPDGFVSYEDIWPPGQFKEANAPRDPVPAVSAEGRAIFPEISALQDVVRTLPADVPIVIIVPPTLASAVAKPGTDAALDRTACDGALKKLIVDRPHSNFISYRVDNALTRDRDNFADFIHYRPKLARRIERGIIASLRDGESATIDF